MTQQQIKETAQHLHSINQSIARKLVNKMHPLRAEAVLLYYRDQFPHLYDCIFWYLRDRVMDKIPRLN